MLKLEAHRLLTIVPPDQKFPERITADFGVFFCLEHFVQKGQIAWPHCALGSDLLRKSEPF